MVNTHVHVYTHRDTVGRKRKWRKRETERQTDKQTGTEIVLLTGDRFSAD